MRRLLKKILRAIACLICFCFFVSPVKANDMFGGTINEDIHSPLRAMTDDSYGNYYTMPSNSAYLWYEPGPVSANTMRVFCFEGDDYLQDYVYSVTIYLTTNSVNRVLPANSGTARRIGTGNSMNAARINFVNNSAYARSVIYTNYSYDYFDIRYPKSDGSFGLQHTVYSVTYFFVPNVSGVGLAVPFQFSSNVSSNTTIYYVGYRLENLGPANNLSSSDIQSVINSSGLATAQSQNEIKTSLAQARQEIKDLNNAQEETNNTIKDSSVDGSTGTASSFFDNFNSNSHGLSGIITAPLVFIRNLLNHSCTPLNFNLPFVNKNVNLPCMTAIYQNYFGGFFTLYQVITTGIIAYWVVIKIFGTIKGLQDPQNDKIEVFKL